MSTPTFIGQKVAGTVLAVAIAMVQGLVLHHELVDCYPFKVMQFADQYQHAADVAVWFGSILVLGLAVLLLRVVSFWKHAGLLFLVASGLVPLTFEVAYRMLTPAFDSGPLTSEFSLQGARDAFSTLVLDAAGGGCLAALLGLGLISISLLGNDRRTPA